MVVSFFIATLNTSTCGVAIRFTRVVSTVNPNLRLLA
jgi:hypothetical protein